MGNEKKVQLPLDEMRKQVDEAMIEFENGDWKLEDLDSLIGKLLSTYNQACDPGRERADMLAWVANFPDN